MNDLLIAIIIGLVAGLIDVTPMVDIPVILTPHSGDTDPSLVEVQRT